MALGEEAVVGIVVCLVLWFGTIFGVIWLKAYCKHNYPPAEAREKE